MVLSHKAFSSKGKTKISESLLNGPSPLFPLRCKGYHRIRIIPDRLLGQCYLGQQPDENGGPAQACSQSPRNSRDFDGIRHSLKSRRSVSNVLVVGNLSSESGPEDGSLIACKEVVQGGRTWRWGHGRISVGLGLGNGVIFELKLQNDKAEARTTIRERRRCGAVFK